jgi:hypothetical protein
VLLAGELLIEISNLASICSKKGNGERLLCPSTFTMMGKLLSSMLTPDATPQKGEGCLWFED